MYTNDGHSIDEQHLFGTLNVHVQYMLSLVAMVSKIMNWNYNLPYIVYMARPQFFKIPG